jgi:hypothetical protein
LVAFAWPGLTLETLATAIRLRKEIEGEVWLALAGALALLWVIAAYYAVVLGVFLVMLGFRLRGLHTRAATA